MQKNFTLSVLNIIQPINVTSLVVYSEGSFCLLKGGKHITK